nr:hypothetical protein [Sphingomonas beigongshangi]
MDDSEYPSEPTLLYAQLDHNMVGDSIFKDLGNHLLYRRSLDERLLHALLDLWEAEDEHDRWSELEYVLRDGKFEVAYYYPDEIDPEEDVLERRERALRRHFGDKPIVYPSLLLEDEAPGYDL